MKINNEQVHFGEGCTQGAEFLEHKPGKHASRRTFSYLKFRGYWRAFFGYCPKCNLDAPAIDNCSVCLNFRGNFPPSDAHAATWLRRFMTEL